MTQKREVIASAVLSAEAKERAHRAAAVIVEYWARRGYEVKATVHELKFQSNTRHRPYEVRTDMINGYPRAWHIERGAVL